MEVPRGSTPKAKAVPSSRAQQDKDQANPYIFSRQLVAPAADASGADAASGLAANGSGQPVAAGQSVEDELLGRPRRNFQDFLQHHPDPSKIPGIFNIYEILQESGLVSTASMMRIFGSFIGIGT